jgi:hypothetical protein
MSQFMTEFVRVARHKDGGNVEEKEMREIYDMLQISSKFPLFEQFVEALSMNNLILQSAPKKYRKGSSG